MQTCRKPGSSPARKRSSTFSSKRRMSSISRNSSRRRSSESAFSARGFFSTFAIAGFIMLTPAWGWSNSGVESARTCPRTGRTPGSRSPFRTPRSAHRRPLSSVRPGPGSPATSCALTVSRTGERGRTRPAGEAAGEDRRGADPRHAPAARRGRAGAARGGTPPAARRRLGAGRRRPAARLERPVLRARARPRATTSSAPRCCSRRSIPPASRAAAHFGSALRTPSATAPRRR